MARVLRLPARLIITTTVAAAIRTARRHVRRAAIVPVSRRVAACARRAACGAVAEAVRAPVPGEGDSLVYGVINKH